MTSNGRAALVLLAGVITASLLAACMVKRGGQDTSGKLREAQTDTPPGGSAPATNPTPATSLKKGTKGDDRTSLRRLQAEIEQQWQSLQGTKFPVKRKEEKPLPAKDKDADKDKTKDTEDEPSAPRISRMSTCKRACRYVTAICRAATRVCEIAERLGDEAAEQACEAARNRCAAARKTATASCGVCQ